MCSAYKEEHTIDKPKFETNPLFATNVAKFAELFPGVVTEGKVNVDLLRTYIGDEVFADEVYEFTWVGKRAAIAEAGKPIRKTLRPVRETESVPTGMDSTDKPYCSSGSKDWTVTGNLYIEGDNLDVLKLLQESYLGKVKMIYIDPPYNTGNDFIYCDDFSQSREKYEGTVGLYDGEGVCLFRNTETNGRFHSDWCSMIYPRLVLARNLLRDDGVIFISIDDNEVENLKKICNEVFGEHNFVACFPWRKRTAKSDVPFGVSQDFEWILGYAKSDDITLGLAFERRYYESSDYPNDRWRLSDLTTQKIESQRPNSAFDLVDPKTGKIYKYNPKRLWGITKDTFQDYYDRGKIVFPDDYAFLNMSIPAYRVFEREDKKKALEKYESELPMKAISTLLPDDVGRTESGNRECAELLGNNIFSFPKPSALIKHFISAVTKKDNNDVVLDFFSGSATAAHAVMQLNAEDGGKRKFIMVQLPEVCAEGTEAAKAGYKNICEIGKERIRRAGEKIKQDGGGEKSLQDLDVGFRVFKLDDTNMKDVYYTPDKYSQALLVGLESNIKEDRSDMDLLFGCLLDWGLPLSMPHTQETIDGAAVHTYNSGDLIACFADKISETVVKEIAKRKPLRAVFRDSSFTNSPQKINVTEIFKLLSSNTTVRVI